MDGIRLRSDEIINKNSNNNNKSCEKKQLDMQQSRKTK